MKTQQGQVHCGFIVASMRTKAWLKTSLCRLIPKSKDTPLCPKFGVHLLLNYTCGNYKIGNFCEVKGYKIVLGQSLAPCKATEVEDGA